MKTVQTVEIILQILRAIFKKFLNVSVKLIALNVKDPLESLGKSLLFLFIYFYRF